MSKAPPPRIWIDKDEKLPFSFPGHETVVAKLYAGDYSVEGLTDRVAIERKSLEDLMRTLAHERERFHDELARFRSYDRALILVEHSAESILLGHYRSKMHPNSVEGSLASFHAEYGVSWLGLRSRKVAEKYALKWLLECFDHLSPKTEAAA